MQDKVLVYPLGFKAYVPTPKTVTPVRDDGDEEAMALAEEFFNDNAGKETWEFTDRAMKCALRLFGPNFYIWAIQQADNRYVSDKSLRCVADSVKFIATGNRDVAAIHWGDILEEVETEDKSPASDSRLKTLAAFREMANVQGKDGYLHHWIGKSGGLTDLITIMRVYFGTSRNPSTSGFGFNPSPKNPRTYELTQRLK